MKSLALAVMIFAFSLDMPQAQVLKRTHKKSVPHTEQIVANETLSNNNNSTLKFNIISKGDPTNTKNLVDIPDSYTFDWNYDIKIETKEGETIINYLLKNDAPYYGMRISPSENLFMVVDQKLQLMTMFMDNDGKKMMNATQYKNNVANNASNKIYEKEKYKFKKVGNKNILGYNCKGYQVENEDRVITFYITTDPDITFQGIYQSDKTHLPKNFNPEWISNNEGILMSLCMEGMKNAKNNMTLTCIKLNKEPFSLSKKDYIKLAED